MNVYINIPTEQIMRLKNAEVIFTDEIDKATAAIVIVKEETKALLEVIMQRNIPTAILVDSYENKEGNVTKALLKFGFPKESLFYKDGELLKNLAGNILKARIPRGVGLKALIELAFYIEKNELCPEMIIWYPDATKNKKVTKDGAADANKNAEEINKDAKMDNQKNISEVSLNKYIDKFADIFLFMKTNVNTDVGEIINVLKAGNGFTLLDATNNQTLAKLYGESLEKAINTAMYSILRNSKVLTAPEIHTVKLAILIESTDNQRELLDELYALSTKKYFIPANPPAKEDIQIINDWQNIGLELDGVIAQYNTIGYYKQLLGDIVITADRFA